MLRIYFNFILIMIFLAVPCKAQKKNELFNIKTAQKFEIDRKGGLLARTSKPLSNFKSSIGTSKEYSEGWYKLSAEYKTSGFKPLGSFIADIYGNGLQTPWQAVTASSKWALLELYCKVGKKAKLYFRLMNPVGCTEQATIALRNIKIEKYEMATDKNLFGNPNLEFGTIGELPSMWTWSYHGKPGDFSLVSNKSFRKGKQVLRIKSPGKTRTLRGVGMPLQASGKITFSLWARAEKSGMSLNLMLIGDAYKWQHNKNSNLSDTWKKYTISRPCPASFKKIYFWPRIDVTGKGSVRIAGCSLVWTSDKKKAVPVIAKKNNQSGKNMLLNPGFEFGWNGWMLDFFSPNSYKNVERAAAGKESKIVAGAGIDGGAAYHILDASSLISNCVPVEYGQTYTLSFYAKSVKKNGALDALFIDTGWAMFMKRFRKIPSNKWTRYSMPFTWNKVSVQKRAYARFNGDGVLLDNIQLEKGNMTNFQTASVMLGVMTSTKNIFFQGKKITSMKLKAIARGSAGTKLKIAVTVRDVWKREIWRRNFSISGGKTTIVPLELPSSKLGVFEINVTAKELDGKVAATTVSRYGVINPPFLKNTSKLPLFGVNFESYRLPLWLIKKTMPEMRLMGARINRFFLSSKFFTRTPPERFIKLLKKQCQLQRKNGVFKLIACFSGIPDSLKQEIINNKDISPESIEKFSEIVKAVVKPMQKDILYWEILNEPNLWRHKSGARKAYKSMPPEKYIKILKAAYKSIKSVNPKLQVVGVCLNGNDFDYLEKVMQAGGAKYMDIFSFHSYRSTPDLPEVYADLRKFRAILDKYGFKGPMINTEQYYAANKYLMRGSDEETRRGYYVPGNEELRASGRTIRNYIQHVAAGVPYCAFAPNYTLFRYGGFDKFYIFNLYAAYNAATRMLGEAGLGQPLKIGAAMRAFVFPKAKGGPLLTLYTPAPEFTGRIKLPGKYSAYDIMGNPFSKKEKRIGLPLATDPIYVKFPVGTGIEEISQLLSRARTSGLGTPFDIQLLIRDKNSISVVLTNTKNTTMSGKVSLQNLPKGWKSDKLSTQFKGLKANETVYLDFYGTMPVKNLGKYTLTILAESGDDFLRKKLELSPMFAKHIKEVKADGKLSEWKNMEWIKLGKANLSKDFNKKLPHKGDSDLSAKIAFGWNKEFFAIALVVKDNIESTPKSPADAYAYDSLQIYFDQLNNAYNKDSVYDDDDVAYSISLVKGKALAWVDKGSAGRYMGEANKATGIDRDVKVSITRKNGKTIYEIKFPKHCLPLTKLEKGKGFGFSILINDNDGKGRKRGITLAPKGSEPYGKPFFYKDLYFIEDK